MSGRHEQGSERPYETLGQRVTRVVAELAKFDTAVVGLAGMAVTDGLVTGQARTVTEAVVSVATALGVYLVPNRAQRL